MEFITKDPDAAYHEEQIKIWCDKTDSHYDIISDCESLKKIYDLLIHDIIFDPLTVVEIHYTARYYYERKDYDQTKKYCLLGISEGYAPCMRCIAYYYRNAGDDINADKYYMQAVGKGDFVSINSIGCKHKIKENETEAIKYYKMAIRKGYDVAMINLGDLYRKNNIKPHKAPKYYLMAMICGNDVASVRLANYYFDKKQYDKAITYYLLKAPNQDVMHQLALCYENTGDVELMKYYDIMAIEKNNIKAFNHLIKHCETLGMVIDKMELCRNYHELSPEVRTMFVDCINNYVTTIDVVSTNDVLGGSADDIDKVDVNNMTSDNEKFIEIISDFSFEQSDNLCKCARLLIDSIKKQLSLMELHFDHTEGGKYYNDAESDFYSISTKQNTNTLTTTTTTVTTSTIVETSEISTINETAMITTTETKMTTTTDETAIIADVFNVTTDTTTDITTDAIINTIVIIDTTDTTDTIDTIPNMIDDYEKQIKLWCTYMNLYYDKIHDTESLKKIHNLVIHGEIFKPATGVEIHYMARYYKSIGDKNNHIKYCLEKVDKEYGAALRSIAYYYKDKGIEDMNIKYLKMAIQKGDSGAMINIGDVYNDRKKAKYKNKAIKYYKMAMICDNMYAYGKLGNIYLESTDSDKAKYYYQIGVDKGSAYAMYRLTIYYLRSKSGDYDVNLAMYYAMMAAEKGNINAANLLINLYEKQDMLTDIIELCAKIKLYNHSTKRDVKKVMIDTINKYITKNTDSIDSIDSIDSTDSNNTNDNRFINVLSNYSFDVSDKLYRGVRLLIGSVKNQMDIYDLHDKYTQNNKGYEEAKRDYIKKCIE